MTSERQIGPRRRHAAAGLSAVSLVALGLSILPALAAEPSYPFEGTWVRANRACTATAPLARTYSAREVTGANTHCSVRKIASGAGQYELFEECRRAERPGSFTETIRMAGPDAMVVRRQVTRLKIARPLRFIRCSIAAPGGSKPVATPHHPATAVEERPATKPPEPQKP